MIDLAQDLTNKTSKKVNHLAIECAWHQNAEAVNKLRKYNFSKLNYCYSEMLQKRW